MPRGGVIGSFRKRITTSIWCLALVLGTGCLRAAPNADEVALGPECEGTRGGRACVVLRFAIAEALREDAAGKMAGPLHWALFRGGDVGIFGPGENQALYRGVTEDPVDLAGATAGFVLALPDVEAGEYQLLAFLDHDGDGDDSDGDPVTFPSEPFTVRADRRTSLAVEFDYLR